MHCSNVDTNCKVIVVGNGEVGKSSMLHWYCKGEFTEDYKKTIGTDYMMKEIHIDDTDESIQLDLWDTAGQEVFADLTKSYYRNSGACALAFSTTDRKSFEAVESWKQKVERVVDPPPAMCLVQTKIDLMDSAEVTSAEADALALRLGLQFIRVSTKEKFNVDKVFEYLAKTWLAMGRDAQEGEAAAAIEAPSRPMKPSTAGKEGFAEAPKVSLAPATDKEEKGDNKAQRQKPRAKTKKRPCSIL
eukprot:TRINITY_DN1714_c1_g3_i1.p1 TRINITY_DN1714_c1_g3~~TRINITY_DN1714_c1_g3_i1.p1  ORF type:complete len:245 (+),score=51.73 TRINITY_DN1714_c1_g3_i1:60-794(+)